MSEYEDGDDFDTDVPLVDSFLDRSRLSSTDLLRGGRGATSISFDESSEEGRRLAKLQRGIEAMRFRGLSVLHQFQNIIDKQESCKNSIPVTVRNKAEDIIETFPLGRTLNPQGFCWAIAYAQNTPHEKELFERAKHCNVEPLDILRYYRYINEINPIHKLTRSKITEIEIDPNNHVNTSTTAVKVPVLAEPVISINSLERGLKSSNSCTIWVLKCDSIVPKWENHTSTEGNKTITYEVVDASDISSKSISSAKMCTITTVTVDRKGNKNTTIQKIYKFDRTIKTRSEMLTAGGKKGEKITLTAERFTEDVWECDSAETIASRFITNKLSLPTSLTKWDFEKSSGAETGFQSESYSILGGPYTNSYTSSVTVQRPSAIGSNKLFGGNLFIHTVLTITERFLYDPEDPATGSLSKQGQDLIIKDLVDQYELTNDEAITVALNTCVLDFSEVLRNPSKSKLTLRQATDLPFINASDTLYFLDHAYDVFTKTLLDTVATTKKDVDSTFKLIMQAQIFVNEPTTFDFVSSRIEEVRYTLEGSFTCERVDTLEMFNELEVDMDMPVASIGKYHKVANGVIIVPDTWVEDVSNESLRFFLRTSPSENRKKCREEDFADVLINERSIDGATTTFDVMLSAGNAVPISDLLHQFCRCLTRKPTNFVLKKRFGKGLFVISQVNFEEIIFTDAVMNQPFIRNFISIDERYGIHKKRGGVKLQLKRNPTSMDTVYASFVKKQVESGTDLEPRLFSEQVKKNEIIYSIQISGREEGEITFMKVVLEKCIQRMLKNYKSLFVPYYSAFVKNIKQVVPDPTVKSKIIKESAKSLKEYDPVLFKSGYSRLCQGEFQVELATEAELAKGKIDVMTFVKTADLNSQRKQFNYKCKNPTLFMGLKDNTNEDKDYRRDYPFIPCCFQTDQKKDKTSIRYKYESGELPFIERTAAKKRIDEEESFSNILFDPNNVKLKMPVLEADKIGKLESKIQDICNLTNPQALLGDVTYYRKGVSRSPRSVISCLIQTKRDLKQSRKHIDYINALKQMAKNNLCAQSGMNSNQALKVLEEDLFIDPIDWHQALCELFQVNIYIWKVEKRGNSTTVELVPPKFNRFLIQPSTRFVGSVVLVMTSGGEFSSLETPYHVEYLVERHVSPASGKQILRSCFVVENGVEHPLIRGFEECMKIQTISLTSNLIINNAEIVHQQEDSIGKIRSIVLLLKSKDINGKLIDVYTSPMLPFTIKKGLNNPVTVKLSLLEAKQIAQTVFGVNEAGCHSITQDGNVVGVQCLVGDHSIFVPCIPVQSYNTNENTTSVICPTDPNSPSLFKSYNKFIKISNCLKSFTTFLFSTLYSGKVSPYQFKDQVQAFINDHTVVIPNYEYTITSRVLSLSQSSFVQNTRKVIFTSESCRTRVISNLQQDTIYRPEAIFDYQFLKYIPDFYTSASDFRVGTQFSVYQTFLSFKQSRENYKNVIYPILGTFQPLSGGSMFFQNDEVEGGCMFACMPHLTMWDAIRSLGLNSTTDCFRVYSISDDEVNFVDCVAKDNVLYTSKANPIGWIACSKSEDSIVYYTMTKTF